MLEYFCINRMTAYKFERKKKNTNYIVITFNKITKGLEILQLVFRLPSSLKLLTINTFILSWYLQI